MNKKNSGRRRNILREAEQTHTQRRKSTHKTAPPAKRPTADDAATHSHLPTQARAMPRAIADVRSWAVSVVCLQARQESALTVRGLLALFDKEGWCQLLFKFLQIIFCLLLTYCARPSPAAL